MRWLLEVVVLDFDLSWHRGAIGQSIDWSKSVSGYIAPELALSDKTASTRSAAIDSFGFGMTLYFLSTRKEPIYLQHRHGDWETKLFQDISRRKCANWKSLPTRFSRLILWSTQDNQNSRWDMSRINSELSQLQFALMGRKKQINADLVCEEVTARSKVIAGDYQWDAEGLCARHVIPSSGAQFIIGTIIEKGRVYFRVNWTNQGLDNFKNVGKYISKTHNQAFPILKKIGWEKIQGQSDVQHSWIEAECDASKILDDVDSHTSVLDEVLKLYRFQ